MFLLKMLQVLYIKRIQLFVVAAGSVTLILLPELSPGIAMLIGFTMAFSMASSLRVGYYYSSNRIEKLKTAHAALLGTHFGGLLCYMVLINQAFIYIR